MHKTVSKQGPIGRVLTTSGPSCKYEAGPWLVKASATYIWGSRRGLSIGNSLNLGYVFTALRTIGRMDNGNVREANGA